MGQLWQSRMTFATISRDVDGDFKSNEIIMSQGILKGILPLQFRNFKYVLMSRLVAWNWTIYTYCQRPFKFNYITKIISVSIVLFCVIFYELCGLRILLFFELAFIFVHLCFQRTVQLVLLLLFNMYFDINKQHMILNANIDLKLIGI